MPGTTSAELQQGKKKKKLFYSENDRIRLLEEGWPLVWDVTVQISVFKKWNIKMGAKQKTEVEWTVLTAHVFRMIFLTLQYTFWTTLCRGATSMEVEQTDNGLKGTGINSHLTIRSFSDCSNGKDFPWKALLKMSEISVIILYHHFIYY